MSTVEAVLDYLGPRIQLEQTKETKRERTSSACKPWKETWERKNLGPWLGQEKRIPDIGSFLASKVYHIYNNTFCYPLCYYSTFFS